MNFIETEDLFKYTIRKALANGITMNFVDAESVIAPDGLECAGYFESDDELFAIATGQPPSEWIPLFLHESCHMDQYIEGSPVWFDNYKNLEKFFSILTGEYEPKNAEEISRLRKSVIAIELDCEKRTVSKSKFWKININRPLYIKQANAYMISYLWMEKHKKWIHGVYENPSVYKLMPSTFLNSYDEFPPKVEEAIDKIALITTKS